MGFFDKKQNNNGYTDLSGMNINQQSYQTNQYYDGSYEHNSHPNDFADQRYSYQQPMQNYNTEGSLSLSDFTRKVYTKMFIGLAITFGIGLFSVINPETTLSLIGNHIELFLILCGIEVLLVFVLGFFMEKMTSTAAYVIFYAYSIINGLTIAPTLVIFEMSTVFWAIAVTACIFGAMSFIGAVTKTDLSKLGPILMFGLIGLIIYSVIALIFRIPMSDLIISVIGIALFMGFTIYDTKKIRAFYTSSFMDPERQKKTVIIAALQLYLDFINLFLYILRLFARNRD